MNVNFTGKYQVNANQTMSTADACLKRDAMIGVWSHQAKNGEEIHKQLRDFYMGDYEQNHRKICNVIFDLDDKFDIDFEKSMKKVGQEFDKLA